MCFSASASFISGTALSVAGIATLRLASRRAEIPFAAVPLLFGIQQLIEGMVWLSFREASQLPNPALTFLYSLFSHVLWPMLLPFAIFLIEADPWRRRALIALQVAGAAVGLYLLYFLVEFPVTSRAIGGHIVYDTPHFYITYVMVLYLLTTCMSGLFSSDPLIRWFGVFVFVAFWSAYAIHVATFVSMWCFFAAILSLMVYLYFRHIRRQQPMRAIAVG